VSDFSREHFEAALPAIDKLLDHHDAIVRTNSLDAIGFTYGKTSRINRVIEMLQTDEDEDVRSSAATALAGLSNATVSKTLLNILAHVVRNESETDDVRMSAYEALLSILNVPRSSRPDPFDENISDINWKYVPQLE
jgi:HEAT repeat protein